MEKFGPFDHETTADFEKGRIEELKGALFVLELENGRNPSPSLKELIENTTARLRSVEGNLARISRPEFRN